MKRFLSGAVFLVGAGMIGYYNRLPLDYLLLGMVIGFVGLGELIDALGFDVAIRALAATVLVGVAVFAVAHHHAILPRRPSAVPHG